MEHFIDRKIIEEKNRLNSQNIFVTTVSPLSNVDSIKWAPRFVSISNSSTGVVRYSSIRERKNTTATLWIISLFSWWTWQSCGTVSGLSFCFQVKLKNGNKRKEKIEASAISQGRLRLSQLAPSNSSVHLHEYESAPVIVQVPPFWHGPDLQGLSEKKDRFKAWTWLLILTFYFSFLWSAFLRCCVCTFFTIVSIKSLSTLTAVTIFSSYFAGSAILTRVVCAWINCDIKTWICQPSVFQIPKLPSLANYIHALLLTVSKLGLTRIG